MFLQMINEQLKAQKLELSSVISGICTEQEMNTYCTERVMDKLTRDALLQRLNASPILFSSYISATESSYFRWRMRVLRAAGKADWRLVQTLVGDGEKTDRFSGNKLQEQFLLILKGVLAIELAGDRELAGNYFGEAIRLTHPDIVVSLSDVLQRMSYQEWCALLNWLSVYRQSGNEMVKAALQRILRRLDTMPLQEQLKIYPYAARILAEIYLSEKRYVTCDKLCESAILILRKGRGMSQLMALLKIAITCKAELKCEAEEKKYRVWLSTLEWGASHCWIIPQQEWLLMPMMESGQGISGYGKVIEQKRSELGLSREKLCDGICSTKTLMRIEKGKGAPRLETIQELLNKLGLPKTLLTTEIITTDLWTLELHWKLNQLLTNRDQNEFAGYLNDYETQLDRAIGINRQWIKMFHNNLDFYQGKKDAKGYLDEIKEIIHITMDEGTFLQKKAAYLSKIEQMLFIQMANAYAYQRDYNSATKIYIGMLDYYKQYDIDREYQCNGMVAVMYNLAVALGKQGKYEKRLQWCFKAADLEVSCEWAIMLPETLMCQAYAQRKLGHTPAAKKCYEASLCLGEMFYRESVAEASKRILSQEW